MNACKLTEEEFNELLRLSRLYHREANRCMAAKSYLAGCVMIGAALEASLTSMCHLYADEIPRDLLPKNKTEQKPLLEWNLAQLLRVACNCGWLPLAQDDDRNRRKAKVGDYAVRLKEIRNFVHPGVYVTDFPKSRMTKWRLERCFDYFEVAIDHLLAKVSASIRKSLAEEERGNLESDDT